MSIPVAMFPLNEDTSVFFFSEIDTTIAVLFLISC
uniref:Uncharacterized protein n=1 Tax=Rhizophora mucronata TaxID=61149 RepID=A0A2P2J3T6_RHIMU